MNSRLHLLFYKEYLEKKYQFILNKYPNGLPLLVITPNAGVKTYSLQQQISDLLKGISLKNEFALNLDRKYFAQYVIRNFEAVEDKPKCSSILSASQNRP